MKAMVATVILAVAAAVLPPNGPAQAGGQAVALNAATPQELAASSKPLVPVGNVAAATVLTGRDTYSDIGAGERSQPAQSPRWSPLSFADGPAPSLAWLFALAFLGLVVLRRTRSSNPY